MIFIWAEDNNHGIGYKGNLPWHLSSDMRFFKRTTTGNTLVSGSRTFASYGKPLPHRKNIVLTTNRHKTYPEGVLVLHSVDDLLTYEDHHPDETIYISGGAKVFASLLPYVDELLRTRIDHEFKVDTYMPDIDYSQFELVSSEAGVVDEKSPYVHYFEAFKRR
ncbi:dihydrofolate reductase [Secundilactobacillus paracollinoides]|uniref:dihydrofolate reductase n=1 Tax=Secundilactobacillus paracollinoides TaxID=240427 RepID=A0A1B2J107_9LACO|nr:dihydrofolate reductase [Secundilactobacillus paracollinoides]ANZ61993.1 dihydrofolate reductase [Secundilactobacillus paracollinoides]ANZ63680.1 dihydrofolate reductase [Secundilactobacillus paracollinoides]ANZ67939.1 dihydrofolate reductase [Secundilactobacillus paracollinoides]KRL75230.1 dihydrofolate reductase [Secundilactobacillus paracollinoides DSM 15502 = JCM 11969]